MKFDILTILCILAMFLGFDVRHVIGLITNAQATLQQTPAHIFRSALDVMPDYLNDDSKMATIDGIAQQHIKPNEMTERAVYDPGDELLRALNAELTANTQDLFTSHEETDYADTINNEVGVTNKMDMLKKLEADLREEQELVDKSALLMKMLEDPSIETLPIVYVEEEPVDDYNELNLAPIDTAVSKRSRGYRRYPWKRHNRNRGNYEPELRYACTPSKEDVFKLLVNLHENRKGKHSKTVNFCNRKRPAKAVFTNIRFLG